MGICIVSKEWVYQRFFGCVRVLISTFFPLHVCHFLGIATIKLADIHPKMAAIPLESSLKKTCKNETAIPPPATLLGCPRYLVNGLQLQDIIGPSVLDTSHS